MKKETKVKIRVRDVIKQVAENGLEDYFDDIIEIEPVNTDRVFKFKVGDYVKIDTFYDVFGNEGRIGKIVSVDTDDTDSGCYGVSFSRNLNNTMSTPYAESKLTLEPVMDDHIFYDSSFEYCVK